jgi:hypothetical protein
MGGARGTILGRIQKNAWALAKLRQRFVDDASRRLDGLAAIAVARLP